MNFTLFFFRCTPECEAFPELRKSNGRIHFASGDHGEGWRGTIDGAIGAGVQAAHAIRNQLG